MTLMEAIDARHSVRAYLDKPIPQEVREELAAFIRECNKESGLNMIVKFDDPSGFDTRLVHYGVFKNVSNYIVLKGAKGIKTPDFHYACGYFGEKVVLKAQQLGLNTCWTALTFNKKYVKKLVPSSETLCMAIALGYGETQGNPHKGKTMFDVIDVKGGMPEWFVAGVESALKAPTAMNQQKFCFMLEGEEPSVKVRGIGAWSIVDLGIAAYHFDAATGRKVTHKY